MGNLLLFLIVSFSLSAAPFWKLNNENASITRVDEINKGIIKCTKRLEKYFPNIPADLSIFIYSDRKSFLNGLKTKLNFDESSVSFFSESGAPRPLQNKMLLPPDLDNKAICHEIVHHYLENHTNRDNLLNAKWFDEGTANYFATLIFNKDTKKLKTYYLNKMKKTYIPISAMQNEDEFVNLWKIYGADVIYLQSMLMVEFFFHEYKIKGFREILHNMEAMSFKNSFNTVTKISVDEFFENWVKTL